MKFKTVLVNPAGALISALMLNYIEYPDSLFACLSIALATEVIGSMLRMCDRLLDPPAGIFIVFSLHQNNFNRFPHMP